MKLDKKIKHKWLKALRSGKYKQTNHQLCKIDLDDRKSYCCLGVLCDVIHPKGWNGEQFTYKGTTGIGNPPTALMVKLGLTEHYLDKLVKMNDIEGKSFTEIASYISKNL